MDKIRRRYEESTALLRSNYDPGREKMSASGKGIRLLFFRKKH